MNTKKTYRKSTNEGLLKKAPKYSYANNSYYLGGLIMKGSKVEFISTAEGRALPKAGLWTNPDSSIVNPAGDSSKYVYEYSLKDHLGNLRVACRCADPVRDTTTGVILANIPREPVKAVQSEDYDAWGLAFGASTGSATNKLESKYKYNGKEEVQDLGIGLYEYVFRWYDAQIAKFVQVDPLADDYSYKSTYDYAENSPLTNIDLDGLEKVNINFGISSGANGIKFNINVTNTLEAGMQGFSAGVGLTYYSDFYTTGKSGFEFRKSLQYRLGSEKWNLTLGTNIWTGSGELKEFNQKIGAFGIKLGNNFSAGYENDGAPFGLFGNDLSDNDDKYRTAAGFIKVGEVRESLQLFTGRRDSESFRAEENDIEGGGKMGNALKGRGQFGEKYTHGLVQEKGTPYRFGGLTLNYKGLSMGINSDRYVRHPFQNYLAHDWISDQRQFPVMWGGVKSNIQYSTNQANQFSQYGN